MKNGMVYLPYQENKKIYICTIYGVYVKRKEEKVWEIRKRKV